MATLLLQQQQHHFSRYCKMNDYSTPPPLHTTLLLAGGVQWGSSTWVHHSNHSTPWLRQLSSVHALWTTARWRHGSAGGRPRISLETWSLRWITRARCTRVDPGERDHWERMNTGKAPSSTRRTHPTRFDADHRLILSNRNEQITMQCHTTDQTDFGWHPKK